MLNKDDGNVAIIDMAISLVETLVKLIEAILSGDFSALTDIINRRPDHLE